jgi:hypothetical protein
MIKANILPFSSPTYCLEEGENSAPKLQLMKLFFFSFCGNELMALHIYAKF